MRADLLLAERALERAQKNLSYAALCLQWRPCDLASYQELALAQKQCRNATLAACRAIGRAAH